MNDIVTQRIPRIMMATILAFVITVQPMVQAKKAEAIAPVVGAGAAAAALAAELGITTEALMTGVVLITAAGTGVYLLESSDYSSSAVALGENQWGRLWDGTDLGAGYPSNWTDEYQKYRFGNNKTWENLTPEERAEYESPADYVQAQLLGYMIAMGLLDDNGNNIEPTPEPDPENEPDKHSKWQRIRNVLTGLGVTGGAVALNEAAGALADNLSSALKEFLFGTGDDSLGLEYTATYNVAGKDVQFGIAGPFIWNGSSSPTKFNVQNWGYHFITNNQYGYGMNTSIGEIAGNGTVTVTFPNANLKVSGDGKESYIRISNTGSVSLGVNQTGYSYSQSLDNMVLNAAFAGTYVFPDGNQYVDGAWQDNNIQGNINYPVMSETPSELKQVITNNNNYTNYINNNSLPDSNGDVLSVVTPEKITDVRTYPEIVKKVNEDNVTDIPDDEQIPVPNPNPNPNPNPDSNYSPNVPENWDSNVEDTVNRIMKNPLDQLFPFCLIADLRDFTFLLLGGEEYANRTNRLQPGTISTQSDAPLEELNGIHALTLDFREAFDGFYVEIPLDPVHELLHYTRTTVTVVLIMAVVIGSFSFFLKRGGE